LLAATKKAILVPLEVLTIAEEAVRLSGQVAEIGNTNALSDAATGAVTANAAAKAAYFNIRINMTGMEDAEFALEINTKADLLLQSVQKQVNQIEKKVLKRLE
jgi:glutamate formiminotransferase/formiminotetrahydrofolate cyclodeaminase